MITDHALRQHVHRSILKMASKRLADCCSARW